MLGFMGIFGAVAVLLILAADALSDRQDAYPTFLFDISGPDAYPAISL